MKYKCKQCGNKFKKKQLEKKLFGLPRCPNCKSNVRLIGGTRTLFLVVILPIILIGFPIILLIYIILFGFVIGFVTFLIFCFITLFAFLLAVWQTKKWK